jgi:hypothetical protein
MDTKLMPFRALANQWKESYSGRYFWSINSIQRDAFIELFYRLTNSDSPTLLNEKITDALIGAMIFQTKIILQEFRLNLFAKTNLFYLQITSALKAILTKPLTDDASARYLFDLYRCIIEMPDKMIADLIWKTKQNLLDQINSVRIKEFKNEIYTKPTSG